MGDWSGQYDKNNFLNSTVIGEFVCDELCEYESYKWREGGFEYLNYKYDSELSMKSCMSQDDLMKYGRRKTLFGWHISDLVIYNEPKRLSEFTGLRKTKFGYESIKITRPPQSWCYVEEVQNG